MSLHISVACPGQTLLSPFCLLHGFAKLGLLGQGIHMYDCGAMAEGSVAEEPNDALGLVAEQ